MNHSRLLILFLILKEKHSLFQLCMMLAVGFSQMPLIHGIPFSFYFAESFYLERDRKMLHFDVFNVFIKMIIFLNILLILIKKVEANLAYFK